MTGRTGGSPLTSVVIPTYYRNEFLSRAIESALGQSFRPIEVLVVDDSGEAHARPVVSEFDDVRYVPLDTNRGVNAARTAGARRARGRYVQFLDDDDLMHEQKIERQVRVFERTTDVGVVYTGIEKNGTDPVLPTPHVRGDVLEYALMFEMWPCMTSTMLIDSRILAELLPFPDREGATDLEIMIMLAELTEFEYVDAPLLSKRIDLTTEGASMAAVDGRKDIIAEHEDRYSGHADRVRRTALANTYETEGELLILKHGWSTDAIAAFLHHFRYTPAGKLKSFGAVVAACFGKPGWELATRVDAALSSIREDGP